MVDNLKIEEPVDKKFTKKELINTLEKHYIKDKQKEYDGLGIRIKLLE